MISIVTVVRNAPENLIATLQSVSEQTYEAYFHLIVDGASTDSTKDIALASIGEKTFAISEKDEGIYDAMNKGLRLIEGDDWVLFLNAGDIFSSPDSLASVASKLRNLPTEIDVAYFSNEISYPNGEVRIKKCGPPEKLPKEMPFSHQAVFVKNRIYKSQNYDPKNFLVADYWFFLEQYKKGLRLTCFPEINVSRVQMGGVSDKNRELCIIGHFVAQVSICGWDAARWFNFNRLMLRELILKRLRSFLYYRTNRRSS